MRNDHDFNYDQCLDEYLRDSINGSTDWVYSMDIEEIQDLLIKMAYILFDKSILKNMPIAGFVDLRSMLKEQIEKSAIEYADLLDARGEFGHRLVVVDPNPDRV